MRRLLKWVGGLVLLLVLAAGAIVVAAWFNSERALSKHYAVVDPPLSIPSDAASLAHGKHLFETRGCSDCHAENGAGRLVMDVGPLIRLVAPNITPPALAARGYDADKIARAVRHGIRADDTPLVFMPAADWRDLSDSDTAALVAHVQSLPPSANEPGQLEVRPFARVLHLADKFPLTPAEKIDHTPRTRTAPAAEATVEYGAYVAQACQGCHGADYAGGPPIAPGTPPVANLTPTGLGEWSEADFFRAIREGKRPDGSSIDPFMPWQMLSRLTDTEIRALWLYLRSLPAAPSRA